MLITLNVSLFFLTHAHTYTGLCQEKTGLCIGVWQYVTVAQPLCLYSFSTAHTRHCQAHPARGPPTHREQKRRRDTATARCTSGIRGTKMQHTLIYIRVNWTGLYFASSPLHFLPICNDAGFCLLRFPSLLYMR